MGKQNYCVDCGTEIDRRSTRCYSCTAKYRWDSGLYDHLRGEPTRCIDCGVEIYRRSTRCRDCEIEYRHTLRDGIEGKECSKCGQWKPLKEFQKNRSHRDGLAYHCRECEAERWQKTYRGNHEAILKRGRKRYKENPQKTLERSRSHYWENKEEVQARHHDWYVGNKGKVYEAKLRRRARLADVTIEPVDMETIYERDGYRCVYCGSLERLSIDHIIPLDSRGPHCEENLVVACRRCNGSKGTKSLIAWMADGGWWQSKGAGYGAQEKKLSCGEVA